jgi:hypothetical protein
MGASFRRVTPQPLIAAVVSIVAVVMAAGCWSARTSSVGARTELLTVLLVTGLFLSYKYAVHIQRGTKMCMGTIPLYLVAVLLPPALAGVAAGVGVLAGTALMGSERGLYLSDMATDAGRWVIVVLAGALVAHLRLPASLPHTFTLVSAGCVLWAGDMLTGPFLFYPMTGEAPLAILRGMIRAGGVGEAAQYLVGLLGALIAPEHAWAVILLLVPVAPLYLAFKSTKETQESTRQVLESMADAVDLRDPYTGGHSRRVAAYTAQILQEMQLQGPEVDLIVAAARVHDIGKIGIPDRVLLKDGRLAPEERAVMEAHPDHGAKLLSRYPDFARGLDIVRHHHEQWDGGGYPDGRKGQEIPFGARVIAVADSFDAMTSDRPYRAGMPVQRAAAILLDGSGTQWEPVIVEAFLRGIEERLDEAESGLRATAPAPPVIRPAVSA